MKEKIIATVLVIMAVAMYTTAVIEFTRDDVIGCVSDTLMACSDIIIAWVLMRQKFYKKTLQVVVGSSLDLAKTLVKYIDGDKTLEEKLVEEYDQLTERHERLTNFLASDKFKTLSEKSRILLEQQHKAMGEYVVALNQRIKLECGTSNKKD